MTINHPLTLRAGETMQLGTCPEVPGGAGVGDTYLCGADSVCTGTVASTSALQLWQLSR